MEVLRGNFKEALPEVSASIKKADFLVIDAEFTGLLNGRDVSMFDAPSEYYKCLLYGSTEFLVVQYGLCAFYWDDKRKHYMNDAYNFYLFPRYNFKPEKVFMCQSSSLDFLMSQGFDLNKTIRDGISYLPEPLETKMREKLKNKAPSKEPTIIPEENKAFIEETCKKVRTFLDAGEANELQIDRCNSFIRMLLHQELRTKFKNEIILNTVTLDNTNRLLKVTRASSVAGENETQLLRSKRELDELEEAVGFSKVARMISESEKLVIGHNMILDVIHTLNSFFQPLPDDYNEFKEYAHCMFPNLLDTKYMSYLPPFKDKVNSSVLKHLLVTLSEAPFSIPKVGSNQGRGYLKAEDKQHEAGYDAYITGLCFLSMHNHLMRMRNEEHVRVSPTSPILKPFLNKLFLAKTAYQDSPCINLTGADPVTTREHVFLFNFPKEWTRSDINNLFTPYGGVTCQFLNDTQAIVGLYRRDEKLRVVSELNKNKRVSLVPYDRYKKSTQICLIPKQSKSSTEGEAVQRTGTITTLNAEDDEAALWTCMELLHPRMPRTNSLSDDEPDLPNNAEAGPSTNAEASPYRVPQEPPRVRSKSLQQRSPPPVVPRRKRTSSGVFEVANEPPPKKPELSRSESKPQTKTDRRRKDTETPEEVKEKGKGKKEKKKSEVKELKIIDKFDSKAKSKCVSAFKESDSWD